MLRLLTYHFDEIVNNYVVDTISEQVTNEPFELSISVQGTSAFVTVDNYNELSYILNHNIIPLYFNRHTYEITGNYENEIRSLDYIIQNFDTIKSIQ